MKKLDIRIGSQGFDTSVKLDGVEIPVRILTIVVTADQGTRITLEMPRGLHEPIYMSGRFVEDEDDDCEQENTA
jgi:hypothetical protein